MKKNKTFFPSLNANGQIRLVGSPPMGIFCEDLKLKSEIDKKIFYQVVGVVSYRRRIPKLVLECKRLGLSLGRYAMETAEVKDRLENITAIVINRKIYVVKFDLLRLNEVACDIQILVTVPDTFLESELKKAIVTRIEELMLDYLEPYHTAFDSFLRKSKQTSIEYWRARKLKK